MDNKTRLTLWSLLLIAITGCGSSSGSHSGLRSSSPIFTPNLLDIPITGIADDEGNFDPAPTTGPGSMLWMSYSHVSIAASGINNIETRLATSNDGGSSWTDAGVSVNPVTSLILPPPADINAVAHEVSRLVYNPYATAAGADPWVMLWHRYLSIYDSTSTSTIRLFQHGWIAMKSGATPLALGSERKLFTGSLYDTVNNSDALGAPEYPLDSLYASELGDCLTFSEPGVLPKSNGIYVAMLCAAPAPDSRIVLLRCDHYMQNCNYLGNFIDGADADTIKSSYDGFSAPELVTSNGRDYLIVSPTESTGDVYRGCVAYRITDLDNAEIEHNSSVPVATLILEEHGDFNGACGYNEGLSGSGIIMGEAFITSSPVFRLFTTGAQL